MITTKIIGGIGNQMFQYAAARNLAHKNNDELYLDTAWYLLPFPRDYELNRWNITETPMPEKLKNWSEAQNSLMASLTRKFPRLHEALMPEKPEFRTITEKGFGFDPEMLKLTGDVYLNGYWQSEKYFLDIEDIIRKEFTLKSEFNIDQMAITEQVRLSNAISVHVRRGDYVSDEQTNKFHGTCSLEYYAGALKHIADRVKGIHVCVFSDDIQWVQENMKIDHPATYISDGSLNNAQEMMLMSYCKHNIIANSSFSWWGAWLNKNPDKIVVAPKDWFKEGHKNTPDLIPESWIRL